MNLGKHSLDKLADALAERRIAEGVAILDQVEDDLARLSPAHPRAAELVLQVSQWIDVGYKDHRLLDLMLAKFPPEVRRKLPLEDYLRIRMSEAFRALCTDDVDIAIGILDFVIAAEQELPNQSVVVLAYFWRGRAHRKKGEYEAALKDIVYARTLAEQAPGGAISAAVIQIQEGWVLFQNGMRKEALRLLAKAEAVLRSTDYYIALGNIESARGRIVRRAGEYAKALEHFDHAIAIYSEGDPNHPNLARTLVNAAYVKRLLALQLRRRIDVRAQRHLRGKSGAGAVSQENGHGGLRARHVEICNEAIEQLRRAREIYALHNHLNGIGSVMLNAGHLHLDRGDIDGAATNALEAYRLGFEKSDHILMARARILQATAENARVEEQLGEDVDIAVHADTAKKYCEEAIALAQHTQNRRLLAGAYVARGMTAANDFFQDWELAKRCASDAASLTAAGDHDHLLEDLATLKTVIMQASGINDILRGWSEGMLGEKTFQQVTEEFAEIVIPKVWIREGRKVSRVAQCLSISPKKVRRILRSAGLLTYD